MDDNGGTFMAGAGQNSAWNGKSRKSQRASRTAPVRWLGAAAVGIGVGAALMTTAQGTAAAAPDDSASASSASPGSQTARSSRTAKSNAVKSTGRSSNRPKPAASTARLPHVLRPSRAELTPQPDPADVHSVAETADIRIVVPSTAPQATVELTSTPAVFIRTARIPRPPAPPLEALTESLLLFARTSQWAGTGVRQSPSPIPANSVDAIADPPATSTARALAAAAPKTEAEREAADAAFNMSAGWIPVVGTVYNGLSLVSDLVEFSAAVGRGDLADMTDEIRDMAIDVVAMVPVVGAPIAAIAYHLFAAASAPVNHLPTAVTDNYTMNEDTQLTGNVLANDSDPDGDPMTAALNTLAAHGSVSVNANGVFTYTPAANFYGSDSFSYTVGDGSGSVSVGVVNITVIDVAEPPPPSPWTRPVNGYRITQEYGNGHTGMDLAVAAGTPVYAAADGVIYFEGWGTDGSNGARSNWMGSSAGISILVQHNSLGVMTGYAHLSRTIVDQGQTVTKGQVIGYVGCTGSCTGPHLHFEVLPMPLNSRNGIYGRVNPRNYLSL